YLDEGVASIKIIIDKVKQHFSTEIGHKLSDQDLQSINDGLLKDKTAQEIKLLKNKIKDIVGSHFSQKSKEAKKISDKLTSELGLEKTQAEQIEKYVLQDFNKRAEKELTKAIGVTRLPSKKAKSDIFDKAIKAINLGALNDEFYTGLFAEKFGLHPELSREQALEISRLS